MPQSLTYQREANIVPSQSDATDQNKFRQLKRVGSSSFRSLFSQKRSVGVRFTFNEWF